MSTAIWIWIWVGLAIGALAFLALILKSVFNSLMEAGHQAERLTEKLDKLATLLDEKPQLTAPESSLLKNPAIALEERKQLLKARIKKQEQRQRRLIASLKRFDPNESRFHE
jgi:F0F1-type ATP synthase delta subunit